MGQTGVNLEKVQNFRVRYTILKNNHTYLAIPTYVIQNGITL